MKANTPSAKEKQNKIEQETLAIEDFGEEDEIEAANNFLGKLMEQQKKVSQEKVEFRQKNIAATVIQKGLHRRRIKKKFKDVLPKLREQFLLTNGFLNIDGITWTCSICEHAMNKIHSLKWYIIISNEERDREREILPLVFVIIFYS